MALKKISRKDALAQGLEFYCTGKPCKHGHISLRHLKSRGCVTCSKQKWVNYKANTPTEFQKMRRKESNLKSRYGITLTEFVERSEAQHGRCACCGTVTKDLLVDHCHSSNEVRGLLCNSCNAIIGFANDNPQILQLAIDYLIK